MREFSRRPAKQVVVGSLSLAAELALEQLLCACFSIWLCLELWPNDSADSGRHCVTTTTATLVYFYFALTSFSLSPALFLRAEIFARVPQTNKLKKMEIRYFGQKWWAGRRARVKTPITTAYFSGCTSSTNTNQRLSTFLFISPLLAAASRARYIFFFGQYILERAESNFPRPPDFSLRALSSILNYT